MGTGDSRVERPAIGIKGNVKDNSGNKNSSSRRKEVENESKKVNDSSSPSSSKSQSKTSSNQQQISQISTSDITETNTASLLSDSSRNNSFHSSSSDPFYTPKGSIESMALPQNLQDVLNTKKFTLLKLPSSSSNSNTPKVIVSTEDAEAPARVASTFIFSNFGKDEALKTRVKEQGISLKGSWDNWKKSISLSLSSEEFIYSTTIYLAEGRYEYKFIIGDEWTCANDQPITTDISNGYVNNVVTISLPTQVKELVFDYKSKLRDSILKLHQARTESETTTALIKHTEIEKEREGNLTPTTPTTTTTATATTTATTTTTTTTTTTLPTTSAAPVTAPRKRSTGEIETDAVSIPITQAFWAASNTRRELFDETDPSKDEGYGYSLPEPEEYKNEPPQLPVQLKRTVLNEVTNDPRQLPTPSSVMLNHFYRGGQEGGIGPIGFSIIGCTIRYQEKFVSTVYYKPAED